MFARLQVVLKEELETVSNLHQSFVLFGPNLEMKREMICRLIPSIVYLEHMVSFNEAQSLEICHLKAMLENELILILEFLKSMISKEQKEYLEQLQAIEEKCTGYLTEMISQGPDSEQKLNDCLHMFSEEFYNCRKLMSSKDFSAIGGTRDDDMKVVDKKILILFRSFLKAVSVGRLFEYHIEEISEIMDLFQNFRNNLSLTIKRNAVENWANTLRSFLQKVVFEDVPMDFSYLLNLLKHEVDCMKYFEEQISNINVIQEEFESNKKDIFYKELSGISIKLSVSLYSLYNILSHNPENVEFILPQNKAFRECLEKIKNFIQIEDESIKDDGVIRLKFYWDLSYKLACAGNILDYVEKNLEKYNTKVENSIFHKMKLFARYLFFDVFSTSNHSQLQLSKVVFLKNPFDDAIEAEKEQKTKMMNVAVENEIQVNDVLTPDEKVLEKQSLTEDDSEIVVKGEEEIAKETVADENPLSKYNEVSVKDSGSYDTEAPTPDEKVLVKEVLTEEGDGIAIEGKEESAKETDFDECQLSKNQLEEAPEKSFGYYDTSAECIWKIVCSESERT